MRGEYSCTRLVYRALLELPPHARRILDGFTTFIDIWGTTSACAENTIFDPPEIGYDGNYLRARGECLNELGLL